MILVRRHPPFVMHKSELLAKRHFVFLLTHLVVEFPEYVPAVHAVPSRVYDAGQVDGAAGLDKQLAGTQDGSARLCNAKNTI